MVTSSALLLGKVKAIGVSNYTVTHLEELFTYSQIKPAVLQVNIKALRDTFWNTNSVSSDTSVLITCFACSVNSFIQQPLVVDIISNSNDARGDLPIKPLLLLLLLLLLKKHSLMMSCCSIVILQVEYHPHLVQQELVQLCREHGIHFQAYSSLGSEAHKEVSCFTVLATLTDALVAVHLTSMHQSKVTASLPFLMGLQWGIGGLSRWTPLHLVCCIELH